MNIYMNKLEIKSQTYDNLLNKISSDINIDAYRIKQILHNIYKMRFDNFNQFLNLPLNIRNYLEKNYIITIPKITLCNTINDNITMKFLFKLMDGLFIESVLMKYKYGYSLCISTQVGCKMGCKFCMSGNKNFQRNLSPGEILDQILYIEKKKNIKISKIVLMGIGEPLDNFDNVIKFIQILTNQYCLNFSLRNITISTSGIIKQIYQLTKLKINLNLSISLHSTNDHIRNQIMPIAQNNKVNDLITCCKYYFSQTKRRITLEYILFKDKNDGQHHAIELCKIIKNMKIPIHVNLIKLNENEISNSNKIYTSNNLLMFFNILKNNNINVTIRRLLGNKNNAACGQLKSSYLKKVLK